MKSNDDVPEDEMLLAEAIAAAKAKGLGWTEHVMFAAKDGKYLNSERGVPSNAARCCAYGALHLAGRVPLEYIKRQPEMEHIGLGNDRDDTWEQGFDRGESLGWAFRCAMTQEDS